MPATPAGVPAQAFIWRPTSIFAIVEDPAGYSGFFRLTVFDAEQSPRFLLWSPTFAVIAGQAARITWSINLASRVNGEGAYFPLVVVSSELPPDLWVEVGESVAFALDPQSGSAPGIITSAIVTAQAED